ncbi:MAG: MalM family protein [Marinobacter sp.]|uniref:MalM family protein n=1 Tax=Marinobacter sp. TaxID=50741 RepID=UPI003F98AA17
MNINQGLKTVVCIIFWAALAGCQVGGSTVSDKEGYFTWVDEQGRVRYSPIAEEEPHKKTTDEEFNATNYPDAEALRRKGYVREGEQQPYFTWRDAEGNVRNTAYQPDTRTDKEKGRVAPPATITPANVYRATDMLVSADPVAGHDPDAFAILGIEKNGDNYLERFAGTCCQGIETENHERWQEGRKFGIHLTENSPVHGFLTGKSPYQLISLPHREKPGGQVMRLRSYANNGIFVPSVVFLNSDLVPVRLVTDLVSKFEPENWHRRGYLEARIPVLEVKAERWMLIFTRKKDLEGQTVVETRRGPRKIPHVTTGEFGLSMIEAR